MALISQTSTNQTGPQMDMNPRGETIFHILFLCVQQSEFVQAVQKGARRSHIKARVGSTKGNFLLAPHTLFSYWILEGQFHSHILHTALCRNYENNLFKGPVLKWKKKKNAYMVCTVCMDGWIWWTHFSCSTSDFFFNSSVIAFLQSCLAFLIFPLSLLLYILNVFSFSLSLFPPLFDHVMLVSFLLVYLLSFSHSILQREGFTYLSCYSSQLTQHTVTQTSKILMKNN